MTEERHVQIDAETLAGRRFPYQEDISLVEGVDLLAATPGPDINWLEDVELLQEEGVPAVFDRYSNSFLRIHFPIPEGRENEIARKVLDHAPAVRELLRHPAQGQALQVPPAGAGIVGARLGHGRRRLEGAGAGGLGASAALSGAGRSSAGVVGRAGHVHGLVTERDRLRVVEDAERAEGRMWPHPDAHDSAARARSGDLRSRSPDGRARTMRRWRSCPH